jgi:DNA repair exonuclease SbcCD ATPase subunit
MSVNRDKYEKVKEAAKAWYTILEETKDMLVQSQVENERLAEENKRLQTDCERWKKLSEQLPDPNMVEDLENENKNLVKTVRALKKQVTELEEKYKDKIARLEREKLLSEGKIQQLEDARKDLQERYNDLKQDFREQQRWGHGRVKEN